MTNIEEIKIVKQIRGQIDDLTDRAETEIKTIQKKAKKNKTYTQLKKRVTEVEKKVNKQIDKRHNQLLDLLGVASKNDVKRLSKKINTIARKLDSANRAAA